MATRFMALAVKAGDFAPCGGARLTIRPCTSRSTARGGWGAPLAALVGYGCGGRDSQETVYVAVLDAGVLLDNGLVGKLLAALDWMTSGLDGLVIHLGQGGTEKNGRA